MDAALIRDSVSAAMPLAERLFHELRERTADGPGVSRESYANGEQVAHDLAARAARDLELEVSCDAFGNLYMTLPGRDRKLPAWIAGSHLDSVPLGGNFDGAAGVVAGLSAIAAFRHAGATPLRDVTVMGVRAEEASSWYGGSHQGHIGSRMALGALNPRELDGAVSSRSGRTLAEQMRLAGFDPGAAQLGRAHLAPERYLAYLELHIEQGPVLDNKSIPVGIVTGIRGSARARSARCLGEYNHSGAVPHEYRSDAVLATVELCHRLDCEWEAVRNAGGDLVFTVGQLYTDGKAHSITKVPGEITFSIDLRSEELAVLVRTTALAKQLAAQIAARRRVSFELGDFNLSPPARMDVTLQREFSQGAQCLGISTTALPSGAGHDAQDFAHAGFRAAMLFVRNAHGSHNPHESMRMDDFHLGTQLLTWMLAR